MINPSETKKGEKLTKTGGYQDKKLPRWIL